jgi:dephospho-CoA kinase
VALTGGIATGKSYVRRRLDAAGLPTIDADQLAREVVEPGTPGLEAVRSRFGDRVLAADGSLDRPAMAAVIFADADARHALEAIVHPAVRERMAAWLAAREGDGAAVAVADIPLLYETGRDQAFDAVIVAACDPALQLQRLMTRDGLSEVEARRRIAAQLPIDEKVARATYVVRTDGAFTDTDSQVDALVETLTRP